MNKIIQNDDIKSIEPWTIAENDFSAPTSNSDVSGFSNGIFGGKQPENIVKNDTGRAVGKAQEKIEPVQPDPKDQYQAKIAQLDQVLNTLSHPLEGMTETIEQTLTELSLKIAGHLFRQELTVEPEKIEKIVHEALQLLPVTSQNVEIHLSHDDLSVLQNASENKMDEKYKFVDDPKLRRGDCKILSDTSQVDATLESRLESIWQTVFKTDE